MRHQVGEGKSWVVPDADYTWRRRKITPESESSRLRAIQDDLPIQMIVLPTYDSQLNPIEKLCRWVRHDALHLHRLSEDWQALKLAI
jgi:hypothetical protein